MGSFVVSRRTSLTFVNSASVHWSLGFSVAASSPSPDVEDVVENSVTLRARGFVLLSSSIAETLAPPLEVLLPFFWSKAIKFSLRELDLWLLPKVIVRRSLPLVLCFTGDTRLWRLLKESDGSLRPRTFLLDLGIEMSFLVNYFSLTIRDHACAKWGRRDWCHALQELKM